MSNKTGNLNPQPPSLEKRLPLALALMMLVLLGSQYFFKPAPGPKPAKPITNKNAATLAAKPEQPARQMVANKEVSAGAVSANSEVTTTIDTDVYKIVFTNRGGAIKEWTLKHYRGSQGKLLELINTDASSVPLPFSIQTNGQNLTVDPDTVLYQAKVSPDGTGVEYEYSDGKTTIRKAFRFSKDSYLANIHSEVLLNGNPVPHFLMWRGGFGDLKVQGASASERAVRYDESSNKLIEKVAKDAKNGPVTESGNFTFAGLEDMFFAAVALPTGNGSIETRTYSDDVKSPGTEKPTAFVGQGISTGSQNNLSFYAGPKDDDILHKVNPKLTKLIDWGFFGILAKPLFLSLNWVHDHITGNYGWAIIVVTLVINILLFPFKLTSLRSARKMQKLQPQIQAINARYKDIGLRDPRKAEQNQEVMALYKTQGVNPLGGCLPLLLQLPFFYAFYRVLNIAIELRHAPWLWVPDLSQAETIPIHLLPLILIGTQFLTQKLTPAAGVDPNQQRLMMFMPLMFGFMFYSASAGLVLYWLTGNLVGVAQQLLINKTMPAPPPPPRPVKAPVKRTVKK